MSISGKQLAHLIIRTTTILMAAGTIILTGVAVGVAVVTVGETAASRIRADVVPSHRNVATSLPDHRCLMHGDHEGEVGYVWKSDGRCHHFSLNDYFWAIVGQPQPSRSGWQ